MIQLEAGKKYTDRRGRVYGPMVQVYDGCYGVFGENRDDYGWYRDGRRSPGRDIQGDLVAEYVEPVKAAEHAPVESPDDWVILDPVVYAEHKLRKDIDWIFIASWHPVDGYAGRTVDEFILIAQNKVRCLRKDLPPVPPQKPVEPEFPQYYVSDEWEQTAYIKRTNKVDSVRVMLDGRVQDTESPWHMHSASLLASGFLRLVTQAEAEARVKKTRTVVLKEWLCWDDGYEDVVMLRWSSADPAVDNGNLSTFDNAVETGNTRTVEIPVT